jgi:hypothetical protein
MRRSIQWMLSLLAIAGLASATAAQAQSSQPSNHSGPHLATNLDHQLEFDGSRTDGKTVP